MKKFFKLKDGITSGRERVWKFISTTNERTRSKTTGLTLVEVVIAAAIILSAVIILSGVYNLYFKTALSNAELVQGAYLSEEGIEVIRFMRDSSWDSNIAPLTLGTNYGLVLNSGSWTATTTNKFVDNFERTVALSAVYRDSAGDIVASGGTLDPDTLMVTSSASWQMNGATTTRSISTYITDLYEN